MNYHNRIFIIRTFSKGENNIGYSTTPYYYQGNNYFHVDFTTAVRFQNRQQAEQEIPSLSSQTQSYLEVIEVFGNF